MVGLQRFIWHYLSLILGVIALILGIGSIVVPLGSIAATLGPVQLTWLSATFNLLGRLIYLGYFVGLAVLLLTLLREAWRLKVTRRFHKTLLGPAILLLASLLPLFTPVLMLVTLPLLIVGGIICLFYR